VVASLAAILAALSLTACGPSGVEEQRAAGPVEGLQLLERLPSDPVAAWVVGMDDPVAGFNEMLDMVELLASPAEGGLSAATVEERMRALDEALGISVRDDLLAHVGSEMAVAIDLQGIDPLVSGALSGRLDVAQALGGSGLAFLVTDESAVEQALIAMLERGGAETTEEDGLRVARFPLPLAGAGAGAGGAEPPAVSMYFGVRGGTAAVGLSRLWVNGALDGVKPGSRLADGADFASVFEALDRQPEALSYLNLPKLRNVVESSGLLQMALSSDPRTRKMVEVFVNEETMNVGIGQTIVETGPGARTSTFGPSWMAGGPKLLGLVAATAMQGVAEAVREQGSRDGSTERVP
jgi:hypothetical protein